MYAGERLLVRRSVGGEASPMSRRRRRICSNFLTARPFVVFNSCMLNFPQITCNSLFDARLSTRNHLQCAKVNEVGTVPPTKAGEHMRLSFWPGHDLGQMFVGPVIRDGNAKISANLFPSTSRPTRQVPLDTSKTC